MRGRELDVHPTWSPGLIRRQFFCFADLPESFDPLAQRDRELYVYPMAATVAAKVAHIPPSAFVELELPKDVCSAELLRDVAGLPLGRFVVAYQLVWNGLGSEWKTIGRVDALVEVPDGKAE